MLACIILCMLSVSVHDIVFALCACERLGERERERERERDY